MGFLRLRLTEKGCYSRESEWLGWIQNKLFNLGAALADAPGEWIVEDDVLRIEQWIDTLEAENEQPRAFILPYGSETISLGNICRTVTRRLERKMTCFLQSGDDKMKIYARFVNRMSDFWFVLCKKCAKVEKIPFFLWKKD